MRRSPLLPSMLAVFAAATTAACSSETTSSSDSSSSSSYTTGVTTTVVLVDPQDFLGATKCTGEEGSLRSFVATVFDHTDLDHIATLPSSPPTPCSQVAIFTFAVPGHMYTAEIDGYEALAGDLRSAGGLADGSRHMVPIGGGPEVAPRWTSTCGPLTAVRNNQQRITGCGDLVDHGSSAPPSIRVDPKSALGLHTCASAGGDVVSFDILPEDAALAPITGLPCDSPPIAYSASIEPDTLYRFRLEARSKAGGPIVFGSYCSAIAAGGLVVEATCDPIASSGSIEISLDPILAGAGLSCGVDVSTFEAVLAKPDLSTGHVPCQKSAWIAPLPAGAYSFPVHVYRGDGTEALQITCAAEVPPGDTTKATCQ